MISSLIGIGCALAAIEAALRWAGKGPPPRRRQPESPYLFVRDGIGYEFAPYANLTLCDEHGETYQEALSSDGFRAEEIGRRPEPDTFRILVVGDSVA